MTVEDIGAWEQTPWFLFWKPKWRRRRMLIGKEIQGWWEYADGPT